MTSSLLTKQRTPDIQISLHFGRLTLESSQSYTGAVVPLSDIRSYRLNYIQADIIPVRTINAIGHIDVRTETLLENEFHHGGRGPELQRAVWTHNGVILKGFEYYNPEDVYEERNIKHLELVGLEAYSMASEEVHGNILATGESKAAVIKFINSPWMKQFNPFHLEGCEHYPVMFYDEIYDVICKEIKAGKGRLAQL